MGFQATHISHPRGVAEIPERESDLDPNTLVSKYCEAKSRHSKGSYMDGCCSVCCCSVVPVRGLSIAVDSALILYEISLYRSQLCLPSLGSSDFFKLSVATQGRIRDASIQSTTQLYAFLALYALKSGIQEGVRHVPFIGSAIAGGLSFATTFSALKGCLQKVEKASLAVIKEYVEKGCEVELQVYESLGISLLEVFKRVGKSFISVRVKAQETIRCNI